ncbi:hypothetical protein D3C87_1349110 [compost metagenome]
MLNTCSRLGLPSVMVPVLSVTKTLTLSNFSKASAFLIRIPFLAPFPIPTMTDMGVARPNAHGHATISTANALANAKASLDSTP